jgi:hypothetical protein
MAWRSLRSERFAPRGKWNTTICIAVVSFLLLVTWMPAVAWPMYNRCFGSLIWFSMRYDLLTLIILCILVFGCLLLAAIISIQLMRTTQMDPNERISASRMSYYLIVIALVYVSVTTGLSGRQLISVDPGHASRDPITPQRLPECSGQRQSGRDLPIRVRLDHHIFPPLPPYKRDSHGHQTDGRDESTPEATAAKNTVLRAK